MSAGDAQSGSRTGCGYVAVIGPPNAGKSTLMNRIVGTKVSIVSSKVQTTRSRVLGIALKDDAQIVFVDTPGLFQPDKRKTLERAMVAAAWEAVPDADRVLFLVDAAKPKMKQVQEILRRLKEQGAEADRTRFALVLNKIDLVRREELLALSQSLNEHFPFDRTFMISAEKGDGVADILSALAADMPPGPWLYPEDQVTDMPLRLMAAEITREALFRFLHEELPYHLTVETEKWEDFDDGSIKIDQIILIAREAHKKIVLGKGGAMIKKIGQISREQLEEILETRVHLKLFVKVRGR